MAGFWDRLLGRRTNNSAHKAKERLQVVLIHDRINLSPELMQSMKDELLAVISKYVSVSSEDVEIALEQRDRNQNRLIAEIPFSHSQQEDDSFLYETQPSGLELDDSANHGGLMDPYDLDEDQRGAAGGPPDLDGEPPR